MNERQKVYEKNTNIRDDSICRIYPMMRGYSFQVNFIKKNSKNKYKAKHNWTATNGVIIGE